MKTFIVALLQVFFLSFVFVQCDETPVVDDVNDDVEDIVNPDTIPPVDTVFSVFGQAQKGPFVSGSSVTIYDLKRNFSPSGRTFNALITNNKGSFELRDVSLSSRYVNLRADGFYYNEVTGQQSVSQITLNAIAQLGGDADVNVNLLTHLEKARVEYLIGEGSAFADAKQQAQSEVLAVFNIESQELGLSESLSIAKDGIGDGMLLAISSILQGFRSEGEMTELLSNISLDLREDGVLDSENVGSMLINHAVLLDTLAVKANLCQRYEDLGEVITCPDFGVHITNFINQTKFEVTESPISYPEVGRYGKNVLYLPDTIFSYGYKTDYSLAAELAEGVELMIKISSLSADSTYIAATDTIAAEVIVGSQHIWYYASNSPMNWTISRFNSVANTQTFTAIEPNKSCDLSMRFNAGTFLIEYYERDILIPTRKKIITFVK